MICRYGERWRADGVCARGLEDTMRGTLSFTLMALMAALPICSCGSKADKFLGAAGGDDEDGTDPVTPRIAAGNRFTCAILEDGVRCWGNDANGQTQIPETTERPHQIEANKDTVCALDGQQLICWGDTRHLSIDGPQTLNAPSKIAMNSVAVCVLAANGVQCWDDGSADGLGKQVPADIASPTDIFMGEAAACVKQAGGLKCWGNAASNLAEIVDLGEKVKALAIGTANASPWWKRR